MTQGDPPLLEIRSLDAGYGQRKVVEGLSARINEKDILLLLGHNGAGKSTLLKTIFGLLPPSGGQVLYRGEDITGRDPKSNVQSGICFVPQGHAIFRRLTVAENLNVATLIVRDKAALPSRIDAVHELFPILLERRAQVAGTMSGGQQQMLAIAMALVQGPKLLMLDEPSIGLSPNLVVAVMDAVAKIRTMLGSTILMVEQNVEKSVPIATSALVMRTGRKIYDGDPEALKDRARLIGYL
ncbi:MAG TPA: ABC transporter ATP-binding protein [Devosia sp.]|nr:ABC transporter ATP-binding protein [Devosia sp.]